MAVIILIIIDEMGIIIEVMVVILEVIEKVVEILVGNRVEIVSRFSIHLVEIEVEVEF